MFAARALRVVSAVAAACVLFSISGAAPPPDATLRWKFEPGAVQHYVMTQTTTSSFEVEGQVIDVRQEMVVDLTWHVKQVNSDGVATLEQSFDRVRLDMDTPIGRLQFDSDHPENMQIPQEGESLQMVVDLMKALVHQAITTTMTPRGEVLDLQLPSELIAGLEKSAGPAADIIKQMTDKDGLKRLSGASSTLLPEEPVAVGDSWSSTSEVPMSALGTLRFEEKRTYMGTEQTPAGPLEKIKLVIAISSTPAAEPAPDAPMSMTIDDSEAEGTMLFDNEKGQMVQADLAQNMKMTVETQGQKIEQLITTTTSIRPRTPSDEAPID